MTFPELAKIHGFKPKGILHVGAAMLEEAQDYKDMGVDTVVWVEAQPPNKQRQARAAEFGHQLYEFIPLSDKMERVSLRITSNEVSSSILPLKRHSSIYPDIFVTEEVPLITMRADNLFQGGLLPAAVDTLVLDVQGAELKVLNGMGNLLKQIQRVWAETNLKELYEGCVLKPQLDAWMLEHGFEYQEFHPVHLEEWGESLYRRP